MALLSLDNANIHYETIGEGPIIVFIPGANGTGDIFIPLAQALSPHFKSVVIDRRGFGQSELTAPLPESAAEPHDTYRVHQDADDIAQVIKTLADEPVFVLGSSSGSIVAMHLLKRHPQLIRKIAFHEPPINSFLPDSEQWQKKNNEIVRAALDDNMAAAMKLFFDDLNVAPIDRESMSKPAAVNDESRQKRFEEMKHWFRYEIRQYTTSDITIDDLKMYKERIVLLNGLESKNSFPQAVNQYIADQLSLTIEDVSGGHLGYVQRPEAFAEQLIKVMK